MDASQHGTKLLRLLFQYMGMLTAIITATFVPLILKFYSIPSAKLHLLQFRTPS